MHKFKVVFFLMLILQQTGVAQQKGGDYKHQVKISPFRLLDPVHSGIEIGYERKHSPRYSTQFSATFFMRSIYNRAYENYKGYRLGVEEKYFFTNRTRKIYLSAEAVYQKNSFHTMVGFIHDSTITSPSFRYTDSVKIKRRAVIFNIRTGRQFMIRQLVTDVSIGIGVRFRKVIYEGKINPDDEPIGSRHPNIHYEANREKNDAAFNLPINLRIGFMF